MTEEFTDADYEALKKRVRENAEKIKSHVAYTLAESYANSAMEKHKVQVESVDPDTVFALKTLIVSAFLGGYNTCSDAIKAVLKSEVTN